jgi:hypothetical protein
MGDRQISCTKSKFYSIQPESKLYNSKQFPSRQEAYFSTLVNKNPETCAIFHSVIIAQLRLKSRPLISTTLSAAAPTSGLRGSAYRRISITAGAVEQHIQE